MIARRAFIDPKLVMSNLQNGALLVTMKLCSSIRDGFQKHFVMCDVPLSLFVVFLLED